MTEKFRNPTREELESQRIQAFILIEEIEQFDIKWRQKHNTHRCDDWYTSNELGKNRWFCKHLEAARKRNKRLEQMEAQQTYDIWKSNGFEGEEIEHEKKSSEMP
jgi:hypothetical protein